MIVFFIYEGKSLPISVLGIIFDSKLQWTTQVTNTITKVNKALNAISLIKRYFGQDELIKLVTANFYSKLYYNSEVWQIPTLNQSLRNKLLAASARALKVCAKTNDMWMLSFKDLHEMAGRATPNRLAKYKMAPQLYKTVEHRCPTSEWVSITFNVINTSRQTNFAINSTNRLRVGYSLLSNRLSYLNGLIDLNWLSLSFDSYKIKCKKLFL